MDYDYWHANSNGQCSLAAMLCVGNSSRFNEVEFIVNGASVKLSDKIVEKAKELQVFVGKTVALSFFTCFQRIFLTVERFPGCRWPHHWEILIHFTVQSDSPDRSSATSLQASGLASMCRRMRRWRFPFRWTFHNLMTRKMHTFQVKAKPLLDVGYDGIAALKMTLLPLTLEVDLSVRKCCKSVRNLCLKMRSICTRCNCPRILAETTRFLVDLRKLKPIGSCGQACMCSSINFTSTAGPEYKASALFTGFRALNSHVFRAELREYYIWVYPNLNEGASPMFLNQCSWCITLDEFQAGRSYVNKVDLHLSTRQHIHRHLASHPDISRASGRTTFIVKSANELCFPHDCWTYTNL